MSEWLSYSLQDLLMFSARVYYRLFERYNEAIWPAQILAILIGFAILYLLIRPAPSAGRVISAILGASWIWIGWAFLWERFATINWPVTYIAPLFVFQALLLIWLGAISRRITFTPNRHPADMIGIALFAAVLVLYPLIAPFMERSWTSAEIFGLAPDPTAIATLALLAIARGSARWLLMIVPLLWCAISSVTLGTMGVADYFVPAAGGLAALAIAAAGGIVKSGVLKERSARSS